MGNPTDPSGLSLEEQIQFLQAENNALRERLDQPPRETEIQSKMDSILACVLNSPPKSPFAVKREDVDQVWTGVFKELKARGHFVGESSDLYVVIIN